MLIKNNKFSDFINTLYDKHIEELNYEYWLHRVFDKSYPEFIKEIQLSNDAQRGYMDEEDVKATVNKSKDILSNFTPQ